MIPDELADEAEEQLVLAPEVPVERLEGDACFPDDGLCREVGAIRRNEEPAGGEELWPGAGVSPDSMTLSSSSSGTVGTTELSLAIHEKALVL